MCFWIEAVPERNAEVVGFQTEIGFCEMQCISEKIYCRILSGIFVSSAKNTFVLMFDSEFVIIESLGVIHTAQCDILYRYTSLWYYTELMLFPSEWFKFWLWSLFKVTFACNHSFQGHIYHKCKWTEFSAIFSSDVLWVSGLWSFADEPMTMA